MPQHTSTIDARLQVERAAITFGVISCMIGCAIRPSMASDPINTHPRKGPARNNRSVAVMHTGIFPSVNGLAVSKDGRYFVSLGGYQAKAFDSGIRVWRIDKLTTIRSFHDDEYLQDIHFSDGGKSIIGTHGNFLANPYIEERQTRSGKVINKVPLDSKHAPNYLTLLGSGKVAAVSYKTGRVEIRNVQTWQLLRKLRLSGQKVYSLTGAFAGNTLAIMDWRADVSLVDTETGVLLGVIRKCYWPIALSDDGAELVYFIGQNGPSKVAVWKKSSRKSIIVGSVNLPNPSSIASSARGNVIAVWDFADGHDRIAVIDVHSGKQVTFALEQLGPGGDITATAFTADGQKLLIGTVYGKIALLDIKSGDLKIIDQGDPSGDAPMKR